MAAGVVPRPSPVIQQLRFRLTKRFGAKVVLDDFALEVRGREFVKIGRAHV